MPAHTTRKPPNCRLQTEMSLMLPSPSGTFSSMTFGEESRAAACRLPLPHTCCPLDFSHCRCCCTTH